MSPLPKQVLNFILKFFFIYLVLVSLLYFTGAKDGFSTWFAPKAESLFKNSIENIQIGIKANKFEEFDLKTTFIDMIELENQKNIARQAGKKNVDIDIKPFYLSSWDMIVVPFIIFIALLFAMPVGWKQRGKTGLLGMGILMLVMTMSFWLVLIHIVVQDANLINLNISSLLRSLAVYAQNFLNNEFILIFAFIIWGIAAFSFRESKDLFRNMVVGNT